MALRTFKKNVLILASSVALVSCGVTVTTSIAPNSVKTPHELSGEFVFLTDVVVFKSNTGPRLGAHVLTSRFAANKENFDSQYRSLPIEKRPSYVGYFLQGERFYFNSFLKVTSHSWWFGETHLLIPRVTIRNAQIPAGIEIEAGELVLTSQNSYEIKLNPLLLKPVRDKIL